MAPVSQPPGRLLPVSWPQFFITVFPKIDSPTVFTLHTSFQQFLLPASRGRLRVLNSKPTWFWSKVFSPSITTGCAGETRYSCNQRSWRDAPYIQSVSHWQALQILVTSATVSYSGGKIEICYRNDVYF